MSRLRSFILIFSVFLISSNLFAQEPTDLKQRLGNRAAMIPESAADTGILFDEYRMEQAANDYFNSARLSGTNENKTNSEIAIESYNAMRQMQNDAAFKVQSSAAWQPIAGSQIGHNSGRIRGVAFDPTDGKVVYIAAASGGVWKTQDISATPVQWVNLSDRLPTVNFGSVAVDPKDHNTVYIGSGEAQGDYNLSPIPSGAGIFKSTDGGLNWKNVATTAVAGTSCSDLAVDPGNSQTIFMASGSTTGLLKSTDGGGTWKKISVGGQSPLNLAIDPTDSKKVYVSTSSNGNSQAGGGRVYRSTDNGETWTVCTGFTGSVGRITIALAPSAPNLIYASVGNAGNSGFLGIWASDNNGVTWRKTTPTSNTSNPLGAQQWWCNAITVHPTSAKRIFVGGIDNYQSNDSGKTFTQLSDWRYGYSPSNPTPPGNYCHADIHSLVFNGTTLYACTDGGLANTTSPFSDWNTSVNKGLATLQFVGVDANKDFTYVTGGCQDNSTNRAQVDTTDFIQTAGGDGGNAWVSQSDGSIAYTTYVYTDFKQSLDSARTWGKNLISIQSNPALYRSTDGGTGEGAPFYPSYDCSSDGTVVAFGGASHVWVSTSGGTDGFQLKSNVGIGNSYAINVSQKDPSFMWAASGSGIYRTTDQGNTWVKNTSGLAATVSGIISDPNNTSILYACTTGGGANKHFWKSTDGGATFTAPASNFPNIPCWCIALHPEDGKLFIGTETGVLFSENGGSTWYPAMEGLPNVLVKTLRVRGTNDNILLAGTYGRGMFWVDLTQLGVKGNTSSTSQISLEPSYPNPITSSNAIIAFNLKNPGLATITVHDLLGRELRTLEKSYLEAGKHQVSFATTDLSKGTYFVMLTANGSSVSEKIVVE